VESISNQKLYLGEPVLFDTSLIRIKNIPSQTSECFDLDKATTEYIEKTTIIDSVIATIAAPFRLEIEESKQYNKTLGKLINHKNTIIRTNGCYIRFISGFDTTDNQIRPFLKCRLNSIKILREALFKSGPKKTKNKLTSIDCNSNYLEDPKDYWHSDLANAQIKLILKESNRYGLTLFRIIAESFKIPFDYSSLFTRYKHVENCIHFKTHCRSIQDFQRIYNYLCEKYDSMTVYRLNKKGAVKGCKFEIEPGRYITIYFKTNSVIRIEDKLETEYLEKLEKVERGISPDHFINARLRDSKILFKEILLGSTEYPKDLTALDCVEELRATIGNRYFSPLIKHITEGDGRIKVTSRNRSLYNEVRRLYKLDVFSKGKSRSIYHLDKKFKNLINEEGITARSLRDD